MEIDYYCINHMCRDSSKCARYVNKKDIKFVKRFKGDRELCDKFLSLA